MSNPSKQKGTKAESETLQAAIRGGLDGHRAPLTGVQDCGDVWLSDRRIVVEVKDDATAGSRTVIERWMDDTDREAGHVISADMGVLVVKRRGKARAEHWPAYLRADDYVRLQDGRAVPRWSRQIVTVQWGDLVALMVEAGY